MIESELFLRLVCLGIGNDNSKKDILETENELIDWRAVETLALQQGLSAIIVDGVEQLPDDLRPSKLMLLQWIGEVFQNYEQRFELYCKAIAKLASFYNEHGYKLMVLKGYACSINWPKPEHRPCGDIDIWLFGQQKEADAALEASFKFHDPSFKIDNSHHHHSVFYWRDFMVENHYDFINTKDLKSSKDLEVYFKKLGKDDSNSIELYGQKVYLPSPNLHALFLLRHNLLHFVSTSMNLRQILDWGFFVEAHGKYVDWDCFLCILDKYKMKEFFDCMNAICVENLGFDAEIFPSVPFHSDLKDKVLKDILNPKYSASEPSRLIPRLMYKYRRWQGNAWKQELCYNESRWSAFWRGLWAHVLKPAHL